MTLNINYRDLFVALGFLVLGVVASKFVWPYLRPSEPACHDALYVFPPFENDEGEDPRTGLPARRIRFTCPHSRQNLDVIYGGAVTCKCYGTRGY